MLECNRPRWHAWTIAAVFVAAGCGGKSGTTGDVGDAGDLAEAGEAGDAGAVTSDADAADGFAPEDADGSSNAGVVTRLTQNKVTKIDLLFMIDNSSSMADKQVILAQAVPDLVTRLVDPICINPTTGQQTGVRLANGSCAVGEPDFDPIKDIHIGIITSSLGSHGAPGVCDDALDMQRARTFPHNDDKAHLVARAIGGSMEMPVATFNNLGFLNWNPNAMMGQTPASVALPFATMVTGVGQHGCGYEASLEAVYRFLIDPDPYQTVRANMAQSPPYGLAELVGTDTVLLKQRADFLRPDSLVAVVMITDENDCSVNDVGQGFYSLIPASSGTSILGHGTSACLTNPNDKCCVNCFQETPPGCPDKSADPECQAGAWTRDRDPENLRCWNQKKRYGFDFLYPITRYVNGFRSTKVPDRAGRPTNNPLFDDLSPSCRVTRQGCASARDRNLIFVAGIVGVPWQDIAVDPQDLSKGYMTAAQLADQNIWSKIVGDPTASPPIPPTDPHMIESIAPRAGLPPPSANPNADPITGHEWNVAAAVPAPNADLQHACIFPLNPPKTCAEATDCDCFVPVTSGAAAAQNPLCQDPNGNYSNIQTRAKAYPGTRQLQFLQGIGEQGIVASICPANTTNAVGVDYGYRPAIAALVNRIRKPLRGQCLPRKIPVAGDGAIPCKIIEAFNLAPGEVCTCTSPGRGPVNPQELTPELKAEGACFCEIVQLTGADKAICETSVTPPGNVASGWCYVDPSQAASPAVAQSQCQLVNSCPPENRRIVRFVNPDSEPRSGANAYLMCDPAAPSTGPAVDPCP